MKAVEQRKWSTEKKGILALYVHGLGAAEGGEGEGGKRKEEGEEKEEEIRKEKEIMKTRKGERRRKKGEK